MCYVLDANVFIRAWRDYYPCTYFGGWWRWLGNLLARGRAQIPEAVYDELLYPDDLRKWLQSQRVSCPGCVLRKDEVNVDLQRRVAEAIFDKYDQVFAERFVEEADFWLICSALCRSGVVVSFETANTLPKSSASKWSAQVKVPNVCTFFNIRCIGSFPDLFKAVGGLRL